MLKRNHDTSVHKLDQLGIDRRMIKRGIVDIKRKVPETGDSATTGAAHDEGSANIMMLV